LPRRGDGVLGGASALRALQARGLQPLPRPLATVASRPVVRRRRRRAAARRTGRARDARSPPARRGARRLARRELRAPRRRPAPRARRRFARLDTGGLYGASAETCRTADAGAHAAVARRRPGPRLDIERSAAACQRDTTRLIGAVTTTPFASVTRTRSDHEPLGGEPRIVPSRRARRPCGRPSTTNEYGAAPPLARSLATKPTVTAAGGKSSETSIGGGAGGARSTL